MFTEKEKQWIATCQKFPILYDITVDNDCVWVSSLPDEVDMDEIQESINVFTFNDYGQDFIVSLLKHIGCNAEHC